ncbi:hypothetical protein MUO65_08100, partial [bacterium]|nr:hypothetical protein [bacterium]
MKMLTERIGVENETPLEIPGNNFTEMAENTGYSLDTAVARTGLSSIKVKDAIESTGQEIQTVLTDLSKGSEFSPQQLGEMKISETARAFNVSEGKLAENIGLTKLSIRELSDLTGKSLKSILKEFGARLVSITLPAYFHLRTICDIAGLRTEEFAKAFENQTVSMPEHTELEEMSLNAFSEITGVSIKEISKELATKIETKVSMLKDSSLKEVATNLGISLPPLLRRGLESLTVGNILKAQGIQGENINDRLSKIGIEGINEKTSLSEIRKNLAQAKETYQSVLNELGIENLTLREVAKALDISIRKLTKRLGIEIHTLRTLRISVDKRGKMSIDKELKESYEVNVNNEVDKSGTDVSIFGLAGVAKNAPLGIRFQMGALKPIRSWALRRMRIIVTNNDGLTIAEFKGITRIESELIEKEGNQYIILRGYRNARSDVPAKEYRISLADFDFKFGEDVTEIKDILSRLRSWKREIGEKIGISLLKGFRETTDINDLIDKMKKLYINNTDKLRKEGVTEAVPHYSGINLGFRTNSNDENIKEFVTCLNELVTVFEAIKISQIKGNKEKEKIEEKEEGRLRSGQAERFIQFLQKGSYGYEILTGAGKTDYLLHLATIAGLIRGKTKAMIILSDIGKLNEAYAENPDTQRLYELLGLKVAVITEGQNYDQLVNKLKKPDVKVIFTYSSVLGFLTDSKRIRGSSDEKVFNILTRNVQIIQDEIHTIYGQSYIRGLGDDRHLEEEVKQAGKKLREVLDKGRINLLALSYAGKFNFNTEIKNPADAYEELKAKGITSEMLEKYSNEVNKDKSDESGYSYLRNLVRTSIKEAGKEYRIAPVCEDNVLQLLAQELGIDVENLKVQKLENQEYAPIRAAIKSLARFMTLAQGNDWDVASMEELRKEGYENVYHAQVVPTTFAIKDLRRRWQDPYDAAVKHEFGLLKNGIEPNLDSVTVTPYSSQASYLEFLAEAKAKENKSDIISMTGTYTFVDPMIRSLGIIIDREESARAIMKYVRWLDKNDPLLRKISEYLTWSSGIKWTPEKLQEIAGEQRQEIENAEISEIVSVKSIEKALNEIKVVPDLNKIRNWVIIQEMKIDQPTIRKVLENKLKEININLASGETPIDYIYHDSSNKWHLCKWQDGIFIDEAIIFKGKTEEEKQVKNYLLQRKGHRQTVILTNPGDNFGMDLKVNETAEFIDLINEESLLTTVIQGFGRNRGYPIGDKTHFCSRKVYYIGEESITVREFLEDTIANEKEEVRTAMLQTLIEATNYVAISNLKLMQANAKEEAIAKSSRTKRFLRTGSSFALFSRLGGMLFGGLTNTWTGITGTSLVNKGAASKGAISESDTIERKLLDFWNKVSIDSEHTKAKPPLTEEFLQERITQIARYLENLSKDEEFVARLCDANKKLLDKLVADNSEIFNKAGELVIEFANKRGTPEEGAGRRHFFTAGNSLKDIVDLIKENVTKDDLPERAVEGHAISPTATRASPKWSEVKKEFKEGEQDKQEEFLKEKGLINPDGTLTKKGESYLQFYREIKSLPEQKLKLISVAIPPDEMKSSSDIALYLARNGLVDIKDLNNKGIESLISYILGLRAAGIEPSQEDLVNIQTADDSYLKLLELANTKAKDRRLRRQISRIVECYNDMKEKEKRYVKVQQKVFEENREAEKMAKGLEQVRIKGDRREIARAWRKYVFSDLRLLLPAISYGKALSKFEKAKRVRIDKIDSYSNDIVCLFNPEMDSEKREMMKEIISKLISIHPDIMNKMYLNDIVDSVNSIEDIVKKTNLPMGIMKETPILAPLVGREIRRLITTLRRNDKDYILKFAGLDFALFLIEEELKENTKVAEKKIEEICDKVEKHYGYRPSKQQIRVLAGLPNILGVQERTDDSKQSMPILRKGAPYRKDGDPVIGAWSVSEIKANPTRFAEALAEIEGVLPTLEKPDRIKRLERVINIILRYYGQHGIRAPTEYRVEIRKNLERPAFIEGNKIILDTDLFKISPKDLVPFLTFVTGHEGMHPVVGTEERVVQIDIERFAKWSPRHQESVIRALRTLGADEDYIMALQERAEASRLTGDREATIDKARREFLRRAVVGLGFALTYGLGWDEIAKAAKEGGLSEEQIENLKKAYQAVNKVLEITDKNRYEEPKQQETYIRNLRRLLIGTGMQESLYKYRGALDSKGRPLGEDRGLWQMGPDTAFDIIHNYISYPIEIKNEKTGEITYRQGLREELAGLFGKVTA